MHNERDYHTAPTVKNKDKEKKKKKSNDYITIAGTQTIVLQTSVSSLLFRRSLEHFHTAYPPKKDRTMQ